MTKIRVVHDLGGIGGLKVIKASYFEDERGYFAETFNIDDFKENGIEAFFVQDNESYSKKGILRGLHVNRAHPQAKLIRVLDGEIYDVAIDLRNDSPTYKQWYALHLSAENRLQLFIPEGFGHGFLALTDAKILFKVTTHYAPGDEIGFAWNSRELGIEWPIQNPILNIRDYNNPDFSELKL